jgi:hypothetical protein
VAADFRKCSASLLKESTGRNTFDVMTDEFTLPRPEYPRPDRRRGTIEGFDWLNLNGPWQFRFDGDRVGENQQWYLPGDGEWREQIIVPFCWESLAAWSECDSAGNENYYSTRVFRNPVQVTHLNHRSADRYEVGWYRRIVDIPSGDFWENKRIVLTIGAADFFTDCWCNGKHVGRHEGGYTPFEFDLTDSLTLKNGRRQALLVLRVEDPMDNHEQPVGKQWRWYTTVSGIWQTVFVEPRASSFIKSFRMVPEIETGVVHLAVQCTGAGDDCSVRAKIRSGDRECGTAEFAVRDGRATGTVTVEPLLLWCPNHPHLYDMLFELVRNNEIVDQVNSYFGMRKIDTGPSDDPEAPAVLRINGTQRYLRGALYQSYHPAGVYTASSVDTLQQDLAVAKNAGFNFLRIHLKVDDPLLLYYADKLGMLLMADFPNFGEGGDTALGRKRFEAMMRNAIERDFNHPSIFAWCMFNETWGFGGQAAFVDLIHPVNPKDRARLPRSDSPAATEPKRVKHAYLPSQAWVQSMWELAKRLDQTRLVEDMSVCHWDHVDYCGHGDTDINSWHFYINDYQQAKEHIQKVVTSTFKGSTWNYVPGFEHHGQPLINSEYGGIGALDGDRDASWSFKFLTNEMRRHGQISAYIYTQHHDVEWEHNGLLNYDRTLKHFGYDLAVVNESNALPMDAPPATRIRPGEKISVPVASAHFSTVAHSEVVMVWRLSGIDTRGHHHQDLARGSVPIRFPHRRVAPAHHIELTAPRTPMLCTLVVEAFRKDGHSLARNFVHYFVTDGYPAPREVDAKTMVLRCAPADWENAGWSGGMGNREEERRDDLCYGVGHGFFEWWIPLDTDLKKARRLRVLCEASAHRADSPQTDDDHFPTTLQVSLNGLRVCEATLRNHPFDARGVLSYLRGARGAYGYLVYAAVEGELLSQVAAKASAGHVRMRLAIPSDAMAQGGLTIYGAECGRFPICPTLVIER